MVRNKKTNKSKKSRVIRKGKVSNASKNTVRKIQQKKKNTYTQTDLENAIAAVSNGTTIRKASIDFGIPRSTLSDYNKNRISKLKRIGPQTVLSESEEKSIVNWIIYRAKHGAPVTKKDLFESVQHFVRSLRRKTPFTEDRPGSYWYEGFRKLHPNISLRQPQN